MPTVARYLSVGVANTAVTLVVIFVLERAGSNALVANMVGYGAGLVSSYVLNRMFTFRVASRRSMPLQFLLSFAISYGINLFIVWISLPIASAVHPMLPHLAGMLAYNVVFFLLMRGWVFARAVD